MKHREALSLRCVVRLSKEMALAIDVWRARLPGIPSRADAIRRLLENALKAEAGKC
jgi:hypothetical protein